MEISELYTQHTVLDYEQAKHLPIVKELERRATAWCNTTGTRYASNHIIVVTTATDRIALLLKILEWKQHGRLRRRGPGSRWVPCMELTPKTILWRESTTGVEDGKFFTRSRIVALVPELAVSEKELGEGE